MKESRKKRIGQMIALVAASLLMMQITPFCPAVFASSEKSRVGITFEGSVPQKDQKEEVTKTKEANMKNQLSFPKTNDRQDSLFWGIGLFLSSSVFISSFYRKRRITR